ncbi:hypothetical protein Tco_1138008 [Tanacetum coccineum]
MKLSLLINTLMFSVSQMVLCIRPLVDVSHLNFFNIDAFNDLPDMPDDEERRIPNLKRHGTPPPHSSSPSTPISEGNSGHSQGADASASEGERSTDLEDIISSF